MRLIIHRKGDKEILTDRLASETASNVVTNCDALVEVGVEECLEDWRIERGIVGYRGRIDVIEVSGEEREISCRAWKLDNEETDVSTNLSKPSETEMNRMMFPLITYHNVETYPRSDTTEIGCRLKAPLFKSIEAVCKLCIREIDSPGLLPF